MRKRYVTLTLAMERLSDYRAAHGSGPHRAAVLADVIWPGAKFLSVQGAGGAASRVVKRLGCHWTSRGGNWGWMI
jgi:hypothetical protein